MDYNPIQKIREGNFSWREDWQHTVEDFDNFYKKMGLEKLIKATENKLGPLNDSIRRQVGLTYASGTVVEIMALCSLVVDDLRAAAYFAIQGGLLYGIGVLHHKAMSQQYPNLILERGTPE